MCKLSNAKPVENLSQNLKNLLSEGANPEDPTTFFVGTYKGEFYILNPSGFASTAYAESREVILSNTDLGLDLLDWGEVFDLAATSFNQRVLSSHDPVEHVDKIEALFQANSEYLLAQGFQAMSDCSPGSDYLCEGFCTSTSGLCSSGAIGEPCAQTDECLVGRCVKGFCREGHDGDDCEHHSDCNSGRCDWDSVFRLLQPRTCRRRLGQRELCNEPYDCISFRCVCFAAGRTSVNSWHLFVVRHPGEALLSVLLWDQMKLGSRALDCIHFVAFSLCWRNKKLLELSSRSNP